MKQRLYAWVAILFLCFLTSSSFASGHTGYANVGNELMMMGFYFIILVYSLIAFPHIRSNRKGTTDVFIVQITLMVLFAVFLIEKFDSDFFMYENKDSWLGFLLLIVLVNISSIVKNRRNGVKEQK